MTGEEKNELRLFRQEFGDFKKEIYGKIDGVKEDFNLFKVEEIRESALHMTREECKTQEAAQSKDIEGLKATINRGLGAIGFILALPAILGAIYVIIQIIKII